MKALFLKELREQTKVGLIGLLSFSFLVGKHYRFYATHLDNLSGQDTQPLLSPSMLMVAGFFCAIYGLVLGWLQMRAEKHRDLWAFLVHRPATRTKILGTKIAVGLCLYAFGAGLPMLALLAVILTPGHVVAPFAWPMICPLAAIFLVGIVSYFAGMLTGVRQARWYGSRGLGLGVAIIAIIGVFNGREFWQALLFVLIPGGILAVAVWGSFKTGGFYRQQPALGKLALAVACALGSALLVDAAALFLVESLASEELRDYSYPQYVMTTNGVIYKYTHHNDKDPDIVDLNGKPLLDEKTGRPMGEKEFRRRTGSGWHTNARFERSDDQWWNRYTSNLRFYQPWMFIDKTLWYWTRDGSVAGYDIATRRKSARLEPPANSTDASRGSNSFIVISGHQQNGFDRRPLRFLASSTTLYRVNLEDRALKPIFTVTNEIIEGYREATVETDDQITLQAVIVLTQKSIDFLDFDGRMRWSVPYQPSAPTYPGVNIYFLGATNRFSAEFYPDEKANRKAGMKLPVRFEWITPGEGVSQSVDLPVLPQPVYDDPGEKVASVITPVCLFVPINYWRDTDRILNPLSLILAALCATAGWGLGRRYTFSAKAQIGWAVFHLLFGPPGLLAFLSVQEWPARETCPHCKKLRVVDREKCPHCGAEFAPPEKNGTEIFESLAAGN